MAETKEILVEVKPDLKDFKTDKYLKDWVNWMKCYVQIEAIECFPCYLKISFYHENDTNRELPFSIIRINIPGVRVGSAASRTRSHTYGIYWKGRKRCRLFMAFPDKQSSASHMEWLKRSIDSLENYRKEKHRSSRSVLPGVLVECSSPEDNNSSLNNTRNSLNDTQNERDMNDILGPLPDIPVSVAECSRWSVRRSSGCSGIYEEILDQPANTPNNSSKKSGKDGPRGSIVSAIYVDMSSPIHSNASENAEMPPPLPPRRRIYNSVHTPVSARNDGNAKNRRPWNIKNIVFGRTKSTAADAQSMLKKPNEFIKSQTTEGISKIHTENNTNSNLLANCMNSFSTPDLTNIIDMTSAKVSTTSIKGEIDETDLDVMDIERSNSLNCSTNQFMCRPPTLNISSNILWSHNLSVTMSSSCDSSAINLVGANVNNGDSFLGHDMSGYCRMAPIILNKSNTSSPKLQPKLERTSTTITPQLIREHNKQMNSSSIYCVMAPIFRSSKTDDEKIVELTKNITFERHFEFDEECQLEYSMKADANIVAPNDETSSSGVSSDDGMCTSNLNTTKSTSMCETSMDHHDDAISLTYTESPPHSGRTNQFNEPSFTYQSTKFDEKLPSYFPNENTINHLHSDPGKYTAKRTYNNNNNNYCGTETPKCKTKIEQHINSGKKTTNFYTVMKSPADAKAPKVKPRRNSVSEMTNHMAATSNSYPKENWCIDSKRIENRTYQSMSKSKAIENKKVLLNLDPNTKFEKNLKNIRVTSSPRRIYNKCTIRNNKTPPIETASNISDSFNSSFDSNIRVSNGELSSGGLIRSWTRFRRIDFSPLKTKITSILQRTNSEI